MRWVWSGSLQSCFGGVSRGGGLGRRGAEGVDWVGERWEKGFLSEWRGWWGGWRLRRRGGGKYGIVLGAAGEDVLADGVVAGGGGGEEVVEAAEVRRHCGCGR